MKFKIKHDAFDFLKQYEEENVSFVNIIAGSGSLSVEVIKENNSIVYRMPAEVSSTGSIFVVLNKLIGMMNLFEDDVVFEYNGSPDKELLELSGKSDNIKISLICWSEMPKAIVVSWLGEQHPLFELNEDKEVFDKYVKSIKSFVNKNKTFIIGFSTNKEIYLENGARSYSNVSKIDELFFSRDTKLLYEKIKSGGEITNIIVSPEVIEFCFSDCNIFCKCEKVIGPIISSVL